jgi:RNA polymerase sigma-70 factor, ECF subfamily
MEWWDLYDRWYGPVRAFLASRMQDDAAAEDLAQETFARVYTSLADLRDPEKAKAWIFRIAHNLYVDRVRASRREPGTMPEGDEEERIEDPAGEVFADETERREMSQCVREKIALLPEPQRTVVILFDLEEFSHQEIAEVLGLSVGAVKVRLHRARQALKEILARECSFEIDQRSVLVCLPSEDRPAPAGAGDRSRRG